MNFSSFVIPGIITFILIFGLVKGVNVFDEFVVGAKDGITTTVKILPSLIALMVCIGMFKSSGAIDIVSYALKPLANLFGLPNELIPLAVLRPISGSGSLVVFKDILSTYGADSRIGRIASVLQGSTETTFYTIAVYYGATGIAKTRHTLACSLSADMLAVILSVLVVSVMF
ncbi:MAG: nucleoside recognition domain-containing protein [Oscillospiraceae bacterium]